MSDWIKTWTAGEHATYRRKVIDLPAFRFGYENEPQWFVDAIKAGQIIHYINKVTLKRGDHMQNAWHGDWLVKFPHEVRGIHHDEFIEFYEPTP
jgi:hypothetical protein